MASTITIDSDGRGVAGDKYVRRGALTLGTYASGGIAVTKGQFEFNVSLDDLAVQSSDGYVARFDKANLKVMLYIGKNPADAGGADVVLQQVGSTDVSATSFRFVATGI